MMQCSRHALQMPVRWEDVERYGTKPCPDSRRQSRTASASTSKPQPQVQA